MWIGDYLYIRSLDKTARFAGQDGEKIKVRIGDTIFSVPPTDCERIPDPPKKAEPSVSSARPSDGSTPISPTIDLHMAALPGYEAIVIGEELSFQLRHCRNYLRKVVAQRTSRIVIIHGHGDGILRAEVRNVLHATPEVDRYNDWQEGAATEVWLSYHK
ncbi:MAG: Smr/MutS family protein [Saprospiraceae bacterium]|nr:Smr/MutS family protein [Saprospiraceae bacterium]